MAQDTVTNLAEVIAEVNALDGEIDEVNGNLANCVFTTTGTGENAEYFMQIEGDPASKKQLGVSGAKLLWTNPNPALLFPAQHINLPELVNYEEVIITIAYGITSNEYIGTGLLKKYCEYTVIASEAKDHKYGTRVCIFRETSIGVYNGGYLNANLSSGAVDNNYGIPLTIHGLKKSIT